ncbi:hypothetical protein R3W88_008159 [Solanum pinnatisectum]|uniref:CCHC-type domain-containing protein n=1 Tax=Solanum pinnatisectum TaxID=50273 RepID=A0AAV9M758_9SOLN|nr:hypothetical protein R3W88_008159 [Solanum pinnatisectum]
MPPRRAVRGRPARRNVEEQGVPNALEVQPHGQVTKVEFREAIWMLSQVATYHVGQRDNQQEVADTSRICELLRMNPPSFIGSSVHEDPENFIEELKKVFDMMHVADIESVELVAYQIKGIARICALMGHFFPRELREEKIREFLTLNLESMSAHEYNMKFTQLSRYVPDMVADMTSRMSLFIVGLSHQSSKESKAAMLIGDMDLNSHSFRAKPAYSQGNIAQRGSKTPACTKCGRNDSSICGDGSTSCFKCDQNGHFMRECPENR